MTSQSPQASELGAVIARLVRESLERHSMGAAAAAEPSHRIVDAVVSLSVVEELPEDLQRLEIEPRAVLTPAAADLLRHRGVQLIRGGTATGVAAAGTPDHGPPPIGTAALGTGVVAMRWIADVDHPQRATGYVRQLAVRGLSASSVELPLDSQQPIAGGVGVVVADLPALHVDHFARRLSLATAAVGSFAEVARIAAAMSPAVWVLDADRLSISGRIAVAAECFRRSGGRPAGETATGGVAGWANRPGRPR